MSAVLVLAAASHPGAFAVDIVATAAAAWLVVCACGIQGRGVLEIATAWLLSLIALVGGAGVILGETGGLGALGFLALHTATLVSLAALRRRRLPGDLSALRDFRDRARGFLNERTPESVATGCMLLLLAAFAVIAAWAEPATADGLTYHMPRIGQWLQDGRVHELASQDERMNFVATVPDLAMAWLLGGTSVGFRPADLAQAIGGILAFLATVGLARQTGLGRVPSVFAGALLFGMANVAVQFTSSQTDLFTAGVFSAAFYLWLAAWKRGEASVLGGAGAGLALGAKGTLFYLAPGFLVWVAFVAWRRPLGWPLWRRTVVAAVLGVELFAMPLFLHNSRDFGDPLGPKEWVGKLHQGAGSNREFLEKLAWNLECSFAQVFEPQSQPAFLRGAGRAVVAEMENHVPIRDPFTLDGLSRKSTLQEVFLERTGPDADIASFGIVSFVLFAAGSLAALARWRRGGMEVFGWSAGVAAFLLFFHAMQQWHPYAFRYFVLAAPWIAVVSAWGIEQLRGTPRVAAWVLVLAASADVCWSVTTHTHQSGWRAATQPERSLNYFVSSGWGTWSDGLEPESAPLSIALPEERPVAGFYRQPGGRPVSYLQNLGTAAETAEELTRDEPGWVVVPALRFIGREGRVVASTWLFKGDEGSPYSVAAYRRLEPGEKPAILLYRNIKERQHNGWAHRLLVKTWDGRPVQFRLSNPLESAVCYNMRTPLTITEGKVAARGSRLMDAVLPANSVSQVWILIEVPEGGDNAPGGATASEPTVELVP
jgi:hypothetical protein